MHKSADAFRTISEVSEELDVPKHVLRFWEARFPQIKPMKRGGGRRYYRPEDVELLRGIRHLLHAEGYTIRGVQKILRKQGVEEVKSSAARAALPVPAAQAGAATPPSRVGKRTRPQPTFQPVPGSKGDEVRAIAAVIAELETLRSMLRGETVAAAASRRASHVRRARAAR